MMILCLGSSLLLYCTCSQFLSTNRDRECKYTYTQTHSFTSVGIPTYISIYILKMTSVIHKSQGWKLQHGNIVNKIVITLYNAYFNYTYHSEDFVMYIIAKLLCCIPEIDIILYVNIHIIKYYMCNLVLPVPVQHHIIHSVLSFIV